jgi:H+/Cl- antiporter ClcA
MVASLAGMVFVRGGPTSGNGVGGHFLYASRAGVGTLTGRDAMVVGMACGIGGAIVGTAFHGTVRVLKSLLWRAAPTSSSSSTGDDDRTGTIATIWKKVLVALAVGAISTRYPQTMFWGEGSLQSMIDGQTTPFSATSHGIPTALTRLARVDPNVPFSSDGYDALRVGTAKFASIAIASAGKYPGGVIFPLLSCGAMLSHAFASAMRPCLPLSMATSSLASPLMTMSFMAATLTSITRTPLATVLILALTASGMTPLSVLLPGALLASYVSVFVSERLSSGSFFTYSK